MNNPTTAQDSKSFASGIRLAAIRQMERVLEGGVSRSIASARVATAFPVATGRACRHRLFTALALAAFATLSGCAREPIKGYGQSQLEVCLSTCGAMGAHRFTLGVWGDVECECRDAATPDAGCVRTEAAR